MSVYVITIFKIVSEIRIQDAVSQEIDKRVLKQMNHFSEAQEYLKAIKNKMLMYNFPFAMIQEFDLEDSYTIEEQYLYLFDDDACQYLPVEGMAGLTRSTRKKLHDFTQVVHLKE